MSELSSYFFSQGTTNKIDPAFAVAVAAHESNWGTSSIANDCRNLFGIKKTNNLCDAHPTFEKYGSFEDSIDAFYKLIKGSTYVGAGCDTPEEIGSKYCPAGEDLCSSWVPGVVTIRDQIQKIKVCTDANDKETCEEFSNNNKALGGAGCEWTIQQNQDTVCMRTP